MLLENNPYESDIRVIREAQTLTGAGYVVSVISPRPPGGRFHVFTDGVHVYHFPGAQPGARTLGYLWEYSYAMAATFVVCLYVYLRRGFDVIHAHNPPDTFFIIASFFKMLGKQFVYDHHDLAPEMYLARFEGVGKGIAYRVLMALEKLSYLLADLIIVTNGSYKEVAMDRGGAPANRIAVVRNGPDLREIPSALAGPSSRPMPEMTIGYIGRIGPQDGVDFLLRALQHLVYGLARSDVLCIVIGDGDMVPALKLLASDLRIQDNVRFTGWVPHEEAMRILATVDICVDPDPSNAYNDRSTMIKIMEYMALGKPIVAFDLPEHRETAREAAIYASPNDELDFARKLAHLLGDEKRCQEMGSIGKERIERSLAWSHQEKKLLEAYVALRS